MVRAHGLYPWSCGFKSYFHYHRSITQWVECRSDTAVVEGSNPSASTISPYRCDWRTSGLPEGREFKSPVGD